MAIKEDMRKKLREIDERAIRRYAQLHELEGAEDRPINELVEIIADRKDLEDLMEAPTRLELKCVDVGRKVREDVERKFELLEAKGKVVDVQIDLVDEKVKSAEEPAKRLEAKIKGIQWAVTIIAILGTFGGGYTIWNFADITKRSDKVKAVIEASAYSFEHYRRILIETNFEELEDFMEKFVGRPQATYASQSPDAILLARVERRLALLSKASGVVKPFEDANNADTVILNILIQVFKGILTLKELTNSAVELAALNEIERRWTYINTVLSADSNISLKQQYSGRMAELRAYNDNILGVVYYRKYLHFDRENSGHLEDAKKQFESAIVHSKSFFPAYSNLAAVHYVKYEKERKSLQSFLEKKNVAKLRKTFRPVIENLEKAIEYSEGRPKRFYMYNNSAHYNLIGAELSKLNNDSLEAQKKLVDAKVAIKRALESPIEDSAKNAAYITKAEIHCYDLHLNGKSVDFTPKHFTELLVTAHDRGFRSKKEIDREKFYLEDGRFLYYCRSMFPQEEDLSKNGFERVISDNVLQSK